MNRIDIVTSEDRINDFNETRAHTEYNELLETCVYTEEMLDNIHIVRRNKASNIRVVLEMEHDTISALLDPYNENVYMAVLNFADGYTPGGLVLYGASTQEEALCRSSNLYESLIDSECIEKYYKYNDTLFGGGKSSDRIIYSRNVTFFRDSRCRWLDKEDVKHCDVITCPAPVVGTATNEEIKRRMKNIINVADDNRVGVLILGCWGCGAFGNSWNLFSKMWLQVIDELCPNCKIVFATMGKDMKGDR